MATKDDFPRTIVFLSSLRTCRKNRQPDIGKAWDRAVNSSRILKTSIWFVTATAIGIAILSVEISRAPCDVTASLVDKSALHLARSAEPTIQSTPDSGFATDCKRRPTRRAKLLRLLNLPIRADRN